MRFLDLFAGIGGFSLGLSMAGMECAGQVENDPFCTKVLEKHWPKVNRVSDIHNVKGGEFGDIDVVCGGFPCQPFSTAGKQRGTRDDRYLWPEMFRVIQAIRPRWVICENVFGFINMGLDSLLFDLEAAEYQTQSFNIPACAVNAQHERKRVWVIANTLNHGLHNKERHEAEPRKNEQENRLFERDGTWTTKSRVVRTVPGVPGRVDRIKALGNAVVPQIVEKIGLLIIEVDSVFK